MLSKTRFKRLFVYCIVIFLLTIICFDSIKGIDFSKDSNQSISKKETLNNTLPNQTENQPKKSFNFLGSGSIIVNSITLEDNFILKGENAKVTINLESEVAIEDISLLLTLVSVPSKYGLEYFQDVNNDGTLEPLELEIGIEDFCQSLSEHITFEKEISFGPDLSEGLLNAHALIPLNCGSWQIIAISFTSTQGESSYAIEDPLTIQVTFNPDEHIVFAYFVHDDIPSFYNGKTIRDSVDQAVSRLENNYPFSINIEVLVEDKAWQPDTSLINNSQMIADAWVHVGKKLGLKDETWDNIHDYDLIEGLWTTTKPMNGGYDILIAVSDRPGNVLGIAAFCGNWAYISGGRFDILNFRTGQSQFDNIIQHELSHVFGALDRSYSNTIMDTEPIFNGTHFTSPCLEVTNYLSIDITHMVYQASRFDGPPNPTIPYTLGKEQVLSTADNTLWVAPKLAQSKNTSFPILHSVAGLKNGNNRIVLYHSSSYSDSWNSYQQVSVSDQNASKAEIAIDVKGNLHLVWTVHNESDSSTHLYYRNRTNTGSWCPIEIIDNETTIRDVKISADGVGNVFLIYTRENETASEIYYRTKNNSNWTALQKLVTGSTKSKKPTIHFDKTNNLHILWYERDLVNSQNKLYYNIRDNSSVFDTKELLYSGSSSAILDNLQVLYSDALSVAHFIWEEIDDNQRSLFYCEQLSNGTLSDPVLLFYDNESITSNARLVTTSDAKVFVFWEDLNKYLNQTYLLYRGKSISSDWSLINRYSPVEMSYSYPYLSYDEENDVIRFICSTNAFSYTYSNFYSRILYRTIYLENYQISVQNFNFTAIIDSSSESIIFTFENIQAFSNFSNIGPLDEIGKTDIRSFGVMRVGDVMPLRRGMLELDTNSGTWFGSAIVTDVQPGEYYVVVAFMDSEYIYSGQFSSSNFFIIEGEEQPSNLMKILIISLSIGVPVVLIGTIVPTVLILKKRKKYSSTES
ncbi:MAG: hypothetical protein ACTSQK_00070 [Candidatus Heimdallarchaeota archaeon]